MGMKHRSQKAREYIPGLSRLASSSGGGYNLNLRLIVDALSNCGFGSLCAHELMEFSGMTRG